MNLTEYLTAITARNATEFARLKRENFLLKKIMDAGWPVKTHCVNNPATASKFRFKQTR